ncbi:MAG: hypothetical protein K9H15_08160 [Bacteroidales bacterium]|nr:hypothetical protein [Bacteroidales bacterium]
MDCKELLPDTSRNTADMATSFLLENPGYINHFIDLTFSEDGKYPMRASRVVFLFFEQMPELSELFLEDILQRMQHLYDASALRNMLNLIKCNLEKLDEDKLGILVDMCFKLLENGKVQVAHKVYAMDILYKVSCSIPEIKPELAAVIERSIKHENTACRNTGGKILQKIYREIA